MDEGQESRIKNREECRKKMPINKNTSEDVKEYIQQGELLLGNGNYAQAAQYAQKALELDEMNLQAYLLQGAAFVYEEAYADAKECFKRALLIDKKSGMAHYHMGSLLLMEGKVNEGIEEYQAAMENGYEEADIHFNLGLAYEERDNYDLAAREYSRAIRKDGLNPFYYIRKAQLYMEQQRYEEALKVLEELRKRCPDSFEGYHYAAQIYVAMGDYEHADAILSKAEEEFSEDEDILLDRLRVLVAKGDIENAFRKIEKAEQMAQDDAVRRKELGLNRAKLLGMQEKMPECIACMEQALSDGSEEALDAELRYLLINAYRMGKNFEKVKQHAGELEKYDDANPYVLGAKYFYASALKESEADEQEWKAAYKEAVRYYRNVALEHPERIESYIYRAVCQKEAGDLQKALETIDYVMLLKQTGKLWVIKSGILKELGRLEEAEAAMREAEKMGEDIAFWKES